MQINQKDIFASFDGTNDGFRDKSADCAKSSCTCNPKEEKYCDQCKMLEETIQPIVLNK